MCVVCVCLCTCVYVSVCVWCVCGVCVLCVCVCMCGVCVYVCMCGVHTKSDPFCFCCQLLFSLFDVIVLELFPELAGDGDADH